MARGARVLSFLQVSRTEGRSRKLPSVLAYLLASVKRTSDLRRLARTPQRGTLCPYTYLHVRLTGLSHLSVVRCALTLTLHVRLTGLSHLSVVRCALTLTLHVRLTGLSHLCVARCAHTLTRKANRAFTPQCGTLCSYIYTYTYT